VSVLPRGGSRELILRPLPFFCRHVLTHMQLREPDTYQRVRYESFRAAFTPSNTL